MVKKRQNLQKFDSKRDAHSNWEEADELDWAWLNYGPPELAERYRDPRNLNASESAKFELRLSLRDRIARTEILAFGIQTSPELRNKAEQIPETLFQSPHAKIDWEQERICGLNREYHDVKVCLAEEANEPLDRPIESKKPRKRGPKGYSEILEEAFAELELEHEDFSDWSLEKQVIEIQRRAGERHRGRFNGREPGRSTVYRFLGGKRSPGSVP